MSQAPHHPARVKPLPFDAVLVGALLALGITSMYLYSHTAIAYRDGDAMGVLVIAATTLPLLFRRTHPTATGLVIGVATLAYLVWDYASLSATLVMLIAVYSVSAYASLYASLAVLATHFAVTVLYVVHVFNGLEPSGPAVLNLAFSMLGYSGVWAIGRAMRKGRHYTAELEDRAWRLELTREAEVRAALAEERSRIARELHDVVAHHVSVMTVQAAGAQRSLDRDPTRTRDALSSIETTGRSALSEMRRIVGILRGPERAGRLEDPSSHRGPQPGVADLEGLAEQVRSAGVDVRLTFDGDPRPIPAGVDVTVFRIVQEALTNTLKHAGPASAEVRLSRSADAITVQIRDNGRGLAAQLDGHRPGHGLLGIRERVALYGGTLAVGPRRGGGYQVQARIPMDNSEQAVRR